MSKKRKEWVNNFIEILERKDKSGYYFKVNEDITLKAGELGQAINFEDDLHSSVESGKLSEEKAEELFNKLGFIKFRLTATPSKD